ncbi:intercompartmental signaling factor BofC [Bacillus luteolus]|uniref:Intercompartmental signaling factor BofC n=1 Tax=Litchfieldia luteola TaxID=682179 RepID=A0ABR9QI02_9BACI|nr:intercompartmental signaling factor BofC [Cytobacillus luteolus]MBE4908120.1 intercompartmental signaling factor BofC [Cytobacillus luteolus]MBP1942905.1 forespore regulator of the sigma-K checkpoint [Cytobacillus luteolus]
MRPSIRIFTWTTIILFSIFYFGFLKEAPSTHELNRAEASTEIVEKENKAYEVNGPLTITVILERLYLDGEVSEEIVEETIWSMEDFWAQYEDWQLVHQDEEQIVFQQQIDDISPLLKSNGYFGITDDGILTIYEGKPKESTKVIQSFFQIDVKKLESHQHTRLKEGIRVSSKDHYEDIIETFKTLSATPTTNTLKD